MPYYQRGRPPEHGNLKNISLSCDANLIQEAKHMNINISEILRNALSSAINNPMYKEKFEIEKKFGKVPIKMRKLIKKRATEDINTTEHWSKKLKEKFHIDITAEELQIWAGY